MEGGAWNVKTVQARGDREGVVNVLRDAKEGVFAVGGLRDV